MQKIATYAVRHVYQFTSPQPGGHAKSRRQAALDDTRLALAAQFRANNDARRGADDGTYPYFIGVFDTVAALINPAIAAGLGVAAAIAAMILSFVASLVFSQYGHRLATFGWSLLVVLGVAAVVGIVAYIRDHFKTDYENGLGRAITTAHMTEAYAKFYDSDLDPNIAYAKHAISIDENRAAFKRVPWGHGLRQPAADEAHRPWFEQVWFAGNHADIGGGYSENESRLSDIALEWMVDCACEVPGGLALDPSVLRRWPSAEGPQHDQVAAGFGAFTRITHLTWQSGARTLPGSKCILHPSVYDRFEAAAVPYWDGPRRYQPAPFAAYPDVAVFFHPDVSPGTKADRDSLARRPKSASSTPEPAAASGPQADDQGSGG